VRILRIESGWVNEFTVVILGVDGDLSGLSNNDELINSLSVLEVLVEVIFEMLDGIHMLLDEIVSSDLLEWESVIIELPSVNTGGTSFWVLTLLLHLSIDVHGVVIVMFIEASREVVEFNVQLCLSDWESIVADFEIMSFGMAINEVFAVLNMINGHETTVPSVTGIIKA